MSIGTATIPLVLVAGKDFGHSWEVAESETGPASALTGIGAIEFRMSRDGLPSGDPVVWSLATGEIAKVGTEMVLLVAGDVTEDLTPGSYRWLLSYGETEAETPLVQGRLTVAAEP